MTDYWLLHGADAQPELRPTFGATYLDAFEPLDDQFGVYPKADWPDALVPYFAPKDGQNTFILLDAAESEELPDLLAVSGLEHVCLYQGSALRRLGTVAPWLVRLRPGNTFARQLLTVGRSSGNLWGRISALYLRSDAGLDRMRTHLRKLMLVHDAAGKAFFLRFWESGFIAELANRNDNAPEILHKMLAGRDATITALGRRISGKRFVVITSDAGIQPPQAAGYDLRAVMPTVRASANSTAVEGIARGLWDAMPRHFFMLGAEFDDLVALVRITMDEGAAFGVRGRAAVAKLTALAAFTGVRPLHDPRLAAFREGLFPVRAPRNDLVCVTRMIDGAQAWRRTLGPSALLRAIGTAPRPTSGMSPAAWAEWQTILATETQRFGITRPDAIAAHGAVAAMCGPWFLRDPLQKRLAAVFLQTDIRAALQAEADLRMTGHLDHAA